MYQRLFQAIGLACALLLTIHSDSVLSAQTESKSGIPNSKHPDQPGQDENTADEVELEKGAEQEKQSPNKAWTRPMDTEKVSLDLDKIKLSKAVKKELRFVTLPALDVGNMEVFYPSILKLLAKLDADELERVETFGKLAIGKSIKEKYVDLKLESVKRGMRQGVEANRLGAISFLVEDLVDRVNSQFADLDGHPVMQDPLTLPETWRERDELFWDTHVFENRLLNSSRLAKFGYSEARRFIQKADREDEKDTIQELRQIEHLPGEVERRFRDMMERETELRIEELKLAVQTLKNENDFETRLNAAFALQTNTENLEWYFASNKVGTLKRAKLNAPNLVADITKLVNDGRAAGEDVLDKAMLLRMGAHWWLRGRYGSGPLANGLLKHPDSMKSEQGMFGLYMPVNRPQAIGSYGDEGYAPGYDRRHFYTWAVEYRGRYQGGEAQTNTSTSSEILEDHGVTVENKSFW